MIRSCIGACGVGAGFLVRRERGHGTIAGGGGGTAVLDDTAAAESILAGETSAVPGGSSSRPWAAFSLVFSEPPGTAELSPFVTNSSLPLTGVASLGCVGSGSNGSSLGCVGSRTGGGMPSSSARKSG